MRSRRGAAWRPGASDLLGQAPSRVLPLVEQHVNVGALRTVPAGPSR